MESDHRENADGKPPLVGSLIYLLANLPLGIFAAVTTCVLFTVGLGTAVIWVGIPLLALVILGIKGAARLERARVRSLLGTSIANPYRPLTGATQKERWKGRIGDKATWRDTAYFLLLLPLGAIQFSLVVSFWASALGLMGLPIYYRFLPMGEWRFPVEDHPWITVSSVSEALPWAGLGVLVMAIAVLVTKELGAVHAKFAHSLLGPSKSARVIRNQENHEQLGHSVSTVTG